MEHGGGEPRQNKETEVAGIRSKQKKKKFWRGGELGREESEFSTRKGPGKTRLGERVVSREGRRQDQTKGGEKYKPIRIWWNPCFRAGGGGRKWQVEETKIRLRR